MEIPIRLNLPDQAAVSPYGQALLNVIGLGSGMARRWGGKILHDLETSAAVDGIWDWNANNLVVAVSGGKVFTVAAAAGTAPSRLLLEDASGYLRLEDDGYLLLEGQTTKTDVTSGAMTTGLVTFADFGSYLYIASGGAIKELHPSQSKVSHGGKDWTCLKNNYAVEPGVTVGFATYWQDDGAGATHTAWSALIRYGSGKADSLEDAQAPTTVKWVETTDSYLFALQDNSERIWFSVVDEPWSWDNDYIAADHIPDECVAIKVFNGELWAAGSHSIQSFVNDGSTPWVPSGYGEISVGVYAPYTFIAAAGTLWFLDDNRRFVVMEGRGARSVNPSLDTWIKGMATVNDAHAVTFVKDGAHYICLHFPSAEKSALVNIQDSSWSEVYKTVAGNNNRWGARCVTAVNDWDMVVYGDTSDGKLRQMGDFATDDTEAITTCIRTPRMQSAQYQSHSALFVGLTRVVNATGGSASMTVRWRDDGAQAWSNAKTITITDDQQTDKVVKLYRLGLFKYNRQYELTVPYPYAVQKVEAI